MQNTVTFGRFFEEISESPQLKFIVAWMTLVILTLPLAILITFGLSERLGYILLLVCFFPAQYLSFWCGKTILRKVAASNNVGNQKADKSARTRHSVAEDWAKALPQPKAKVYERVVRDWESNFAIMSVALDSALSHRAHGDSDGARQDAATAANYLQRIAGTLSSSCDTMAQFAKNLRELPIVEPLKPEFFRGETAQNAAHWNELLHHVLFANRSRFFQKVRILDGTTLQSAAEFRTIVDRVSQVVSESSARDWKTLDRLQYDLNTCLCETEILLKSFFLVLPSNKLVAFAEGLADVRPPLDETAVNAHNRDQLLIEGYAQRRAVTCEVIVLRKRAS